MAEKNTLLLGTRKGMVVYKRNGGGQWSYDRTHFLGIPVTIATIDQNTGYWWALLDHGHWGCKIHRSVDGEKWEEIEAPKYGEDDEVKDGVPAVTKLLWAFASAGADRPGEILIGTEPGGLFRSKDNGDSFELVRSLWEHPSRKEGWFGGGRDHPAIHSINVDPRDSDHFYIGISCAGVFETKDGGVTWSAKSSGLKADFLPDPNSEIGQDPHLVVMSDVNPDVLWQQNHCGIFKSTNGGDQWEDVSQQGGPANFGFAVAVHEENPDMAWVVPGVSDEVRVAVDQSLCVCRTEDGGKTWHDFRDGLPQRDSFDIVFRHALDITGDTLAFGSTTGNLYLSENLGENWHCVTANLPMVHSVEFV